MLTVADLDVAAHAEAYHEQHGADSRGQVAQMIDDALIQAQHNAEENRAEQAWLRIQPSTEDIVGLIKAKRTKLIKKARTKPNYSDAVTAANRLVTSLEDTQQTAISIQDFQTEAKLAIERAKETRQNKVYI